MPDGDADGWVYVAILVLLGAPWEYRHALAVGSLIPAAFWLGKLL